MVITTFGELEIAGMPDAAVPNVRGQTLDVARNTLRQAGCQASVNDVAASGRITVYPAR